MCAIVGWSGHLPKGLLTSLISQSEVRGHDSTGLAFRLPESTVSYRQAVPASVFVSRKANQAFLGDARRSIAGLAHTRRASRGMPIDKDNAHPFLFWRYFFAHNGKIQNWQELKSSLIEKYEKMVESAKDDQVKDSSKWCVDYAKSIQTDSKVLGPYIHAENFSNIIGCMALVWLKDSECFVTRAAKEAIATTISWRYINPPANEPATSDEMVTIVTSTPEIFDKAIKSIEGVVEINATTRIEFPENVIYKITPTGLVVHKKLQVAGAVEDKFTSETDTKVTTEVKPGEVA